MNAWYEIDLWFRMRTYWIAIYGSHNKILCIGIDIQIDKLASPAIRIQINFFSLSFLRLFIPIYSLSLSPFSSILLFVFLIILTKTRISLNSNMYRSRD